MNRWDWKKAAVFLMVVVLLMNTSFSEKSVRFCIDKVEAENPWVFYSTINSLKYYNKPGGFSNSEGVAIEGGSISIGANGNTLYYIDSGDGVGSASGQAYRPVIDLSMYNIKVIMTVHDVTPPGGYNCLQAYKDGDTVFNQYNFTTTASTTMIYDSSVDTSFGMYGSWNWYQSAWQGGNRISITIYTQIKNVDPNISIVSPSPNETFGSQHTAVIPQISVSDPDNNALTCKYYIDGVERETRTIASNTITPQTVSFSAVNIGAMPEGAHTMRFEVSDGSLTDEDTISFSIDKTPPSIASLTASSTENSITANCSAWDAAAGMDTQPYHYTISDGVSNYQSGWVAEGTHTQRLLQPDRRYEVSLNVRDRVGNTTDSRMPIYTKAQRPAITLGNATTTSIDITVGDSNPATTEYQIEAGTRYIDSSGALTAVPQWIKLTNKRVRATGLTPNTTYGIKAKARNSAAEETQPSAVIPGTTLPIAPQNVTAQPEKEYITISWTAMSNIMRYEVETDGKIESAGTAAYYTHNNLDPNTQHSYKVRAVNAAGAAGAWSGTLTVTTLPDPPEMPKNLRADKVMQREMLLAWDTVVGATSYELEANGEVITGITQSTFAHKNLQPNTSYTYRVLARNKGGGSGWSDLLNVYTLPDPPETPEGLVAKETTKDTVTLSWNKAERAEGYNIEADGVIIASTTETTYLHIGLIADTEHRYRINARNIGGDSNWTEILRAKTLPEKPSIPDNLTAISDKDEIILSWDKAERAVEYDIEADGRLLATITGTSYTQAGLAPDTKHSYRIKARNAGGESDYSTMVTAYTLSEATGMALTNVAAVVTNTSITLMWDAVAADAEYDVEVDGEVKDLGKNTTYIHSSLQPVTPHTYKIRPRRGDEPGPWCAVLAIFTLPNAPDAPNITKVIVTNTTIQLMWEPEAGATGYDIEIDGNNVKSTAGTMYLHENLYPGTQHSYRIRAINIGGATPWSEAVIKTTTKPDYMIEAKAGEEYHIALTARGMQEFRGRKIVLKYNPEEVEIMDLCEETRALELESGKLPGTNITMNHTAGRIELEVDQMIAAGKTWAGVMDTILIRARITGQISLIYEVE